MSETLTPENLLAALPQCTIGSTLPIALQVEAANWKSTAQQLYTQHHLTMMVSMTGTDRESVLELMIHLRCVDTWQTIILKTTLEPTAAEIETLSHIWPAAEFLEREVYDLLGVRFTHHPDLRRIFLEDDFEGHPLRKNFQIPTHTQPASNGNTIGS